MLDVEDGLPELGAHSIHRLEDVVLEDFLTNFIPEVFLRIEFRGIGRKIQQRDAIPSSSAPSPPPTSSTHSDVEVLLDTEKYRP